MNYKVSRFKLCEAFDFAYGMTKYMSQQAYILGDSLPCWKDINVGDAQISKTLAKTQKLIQNSTGYCLAWDTFLTGSAIDAHYNLLQGLIEGSISPEEFASQMQEAKETALKEAASAK
jgi:raffinose/stachyose/melibiose transport system substrate-binding protein